MRLKSAQIQNFRAFSDQTIEFDNYTCLVGPNGSGKSTVLNALNILFRESSDPTDVTMLQEEDFHHRNTDAPVVITATFTDLPEAAREDFKAYLRNELLVLKAKAVWDRDTRRAPVVQFGARWVIASFRPYFEADESGASAEELKTIYRSIRDEFPELPDVWVKAEMRRALRNFEEEHPAQCELIDSEDHFYGWTRGVDKLEKYLQWIYVPAVKDPTEEDSERRGTALGQLLNRTVHSKVDFEGPLTELRNELAREYQKILVDQGEALESISKNLESRLRKWSHEGVRLKVNWHYDPSASISLKQPPAHIQVGEGPFLGDLVRAGCCVK